MVDVAQIRREHVLAAIAHLEQSDGGSTEAETADFLYRLYRGDRSYDVQAVMIAASSLATGEPVSAAEFSAYDAAMVARGLAFRVDEDDLPPLRFTRASTVGREHARQTWTLAARERLLEAAENYHAVVTREDLAAYVQRRSLIKNEQKSPSWIDDVLRRVAAQCVALNEPMLSSLVVDHKGRVGVGYQRGLEAAGGQLPADLEEHAAHERLACYRYFGAELPADGGQPCYTSVSPAPRARSRRARQAVAAGAARATAVAASNAPVVGPEVCAVHFIELPPSGSCDLCDG